MSRHWTPRLVVAVVAALLAPSAYANAGAAEVGAGGVQLRDERRVWLKKETLHIAMNAIAVDYEFVNQTDEKIATEVAFPVPDYWYDLANDSYDSFDDFRLWVAGRRVRVPLDGRAILRSASSERDVTNTVREAGLSVERLGGISDFQEVSPSGASRSLRVRAAIADLRESQKRELERQHILGNEGGFLIPNWTVRSSYHWRQIFPPRTPVAVRVEYSPVRGSETFAGAGELEAACVSPAARRVMEGRKWAASWVSYTLTNANTWKTPIGEFELVVRRPEKGIASFCWDGKVEEGEDSHLRAFVKDYVPKREVKVFFFHPR